MPTGACPTKHEYHAQPLDLIPFLTGKKARTAVRTLSRRFLSHQLIGASGQSSGSGLVLARSTRKHY